MMPEVFSKSILTSGFPEKPQATDDSLCRQMFDCRASWSDQFARNFLQKWRGHLIVDDLRLQRIFPARRE